MEDDCVPASCYWSGSVWISPRHLWTPEAEGLSEVVDCFDPTLSSSFARCISGGPTLFLQLHYRFRVIFMIAE